MLLVLCKVGCSVLVFKRQNRRIGELIHKIGSVFPKTTQCVKIAAFHDKIFNSACLDDKCHTNGDVCHYKSQTPFINMNAMFRQDYVQLAIFAGLNENQISQLTPYMVECHFSEDEIIFEQGQPADHIFILLSGEVVVNYKPYDGPALTVARIMPGGVFGWSAALGREVYTSGAQAVQECIAYRLRGANLPVICEKHPETGMILLDRLASVIAERLRGTHTQILGILSQGMDVDGNCLRRITKNDGKHP